MQAISPAKIDQALNQLQSWSEGLALTVKSIAPQVRDALKPGSPIPANAPSRGSVAEMVFHQIEKRFTEVEAAMKQARAATWTDPNAKGR